MSRTWVDPESGFDSLFSTIQHSSWRWECQGYYRVDHDAMQRWLDGKPAVANLADQSWVDYIRGLTNAAIPFARVRMLTEPLTDYLRWMLATTQRNVDAGEDIRWLTQSVARDLDMPHYDFYLFDDNRVLIMSFDDNHLLAESELIDDADVVHQHRELRDRVWSRAIPHKDYLAQRG